MRSSSSMTRIRLLMGEIIAYPSGMNRRRGLAAPASVHSEERRQNRELGQVDGGAGFGQFLLGFFGGILGHAFEHLGIGGLGQVLGFFQAQAGELPNDL